MDLQNTKVEGEIRRRWQSRLLLWLLLPIATTGLALRVASAPTGATVEGLLICVVFGLMVWLLRAATPFAAITGFVLTASLYLSTVAQPRGSWRHTALLPGLSLFVLAFLATRFRRGHKERSGLAESRRGRGASQVAANMGVAAIAALALPPPILWLGHILAGPILYAPLVAALAEAAADTVSSEMGQAIGGQPRLLTTLKAAPPGTDGAISWAGTAAGCAAAAIVVVTSAATLPLRGRQAAVAYLAAIAGLFADSLLGATLERRGWLNNDLVNFLSTGIAALLATACQLGLHV